MLDSDIRALLDQIDERLSRMDRGSQQLADVLSALRGPDEMKQNKDRTTIPIRRAAFPMMARRVTWANGMLLNSFFTYREPGKVELLSDGPEHDSNHFHRHIRSAAEALNLTIITPSEPNQP